MPIRVNAVFIQPQGSSKLKPWCATCRCHMKISEHGRAYCPSCGQLDNGMKQVEKRLTVDVEPFIVNKRMAKGRNTLEGALPRGASLISDKDELGNDKTKVPVV